MLAQTPQDPQAASNTSAFGLSKDVHVPLMVKLCYLQPSDLANSRKRLAKPSTKYSNPSVFSKLSNIYANSDLVVQVEVLSGTSHNPLTLATHSLYHSFPSSKRVWNKELELPINYNQLSIDTYLKFTLVEVSHTEPVVFGVGCLSLFNRTNLTLRRGIQKVGVSTEDTSKAVIEYGELPGITDIEKKLILYENGEFSKVDWLNKMSLPKVEKKRNEQLMLSNSVDDKYPFYLYVELPNFELPVVFSDMSYHIPDTKKIVDQFISNKNTLSDGNGTSIIINSVDLSLSRKTAAVKVFDPDFHVSNLHLLQNSSINGQAAINTNPSSKLDPIEYKYHRLERNMNNSILLDKELKPTPQLRDELLKILNKPSNIELTDVEKNLIWKFRYYFSKNIATNSTNDNTKDVPKTEASKASQLFLTKFLKSINWDNDYELDHAFNDIIPNYWSVDKIQIGDALELLSNYFNPRTLVTRSDAATDNKKDKNNETRLEKIFRYVHVLRNFAVDRLRLASGEELLLYLLQLVQALKYESLIVESELSVNFSGEYVLAEESDEVLSKSTLASFLVEKSVENSKLGNFFYWFVKVENEDQLNTHGPKALKIYSVVLNKYIEDVKNYSDKHKLPTYNYLKRQVWFIKKLTALVELLRSTFKKNEATVKKIQFLRDYLAESSNELLKFPHAFPLPLDPSVIICGCYPEESSVFKSSLAPLKITFKTVLPNKDSNQMFGKKTHKYGKYTLMFKSGDDLRQDQLVIQIIDLMDQLLKNENLDLKLTPYRILATSPIAGMIQFVENETLDAVLVKNYSFQDAETASGPSTVNTNSNGILNYLKYHSRELQQAEPAASSVLGTPSRAPVREQHAITSDLGISTVVMDNYVKSCAGYCVITYLLGVGDRHLDNLLLSPNGKFWHADFGYILGRDPKPFPPLMKLPIQVIDGMGGLEHENFNIFKNYCFVTYTTLRQNSNLILNLFQLMLDASIPDIQIDPLRAVEKVQEKFCLEMTEEEAILHFQNLINDSVNAFLPVVIDRLHSLAQYWRA